jgi:hypothetical protein
MLLTPMPVNRKKSFPSLNVAQRGVLAPIIPKMGQLGRVFAGSSHLTKEKPVA